MTVPSTPSEPSEPSEPFKPSEPSIPLSPGTLDTAAVAGIRAERLDWRFRCVPPALAGMALAEVAAARPGLFSAGFLGPVVVLENAALEHNLRIMARWCAEHGVALAPHGKTTMAPQLFARQLEHGAWGITAATAGQLRVYRAFGVSRVLLANQLVDPAALAWLAGELAADPGFEFGCWVDSVRGVRLMHDALAAAHADRPVDVLVELGAEGGRTGVRDRDTALAVAEAVRDSPTLRLAGVAGYEAALAHDASAASLTRVESYLDELRGLTVALAERGLLASGRPVIVTAGGSAFFDQVAAGITTGWPAGLDVLPILRSGAYLTHDDGFYRAISPLGATPRTEGSPLRSALRAWAQVSSRPANDLALLTLGRRDVSFDQGLPEPQWHRTSGGSAAPLAGHEITALNDQHAFLRLPAGSPLDVGDWVGLGLSHPCTVFDKWSLLPVVDADGETVVDFVRTYF
ncbi:D-serine deaminase, pyridoxal phosphate-dependent [Amycolatopsis arida]|uniref:D-serine deaminase, pyridoxal phosphate-dependent n=1 Tax=Amycolatopsis arida TaxID=587909 RepID=A0A1I6AGU2_9PSEU|nr:amino acid deaminase [Amycolatopsis arida]TDX97730.1 D-serine deaminase-like pyridoxal phosphate-dependent protein [Amycolatopsis arida]SFQ67880.1 D-serine deaminase, pyridoxal phosphate-dependent [Amycolatopsis arida]